MMAQCFGYRSSRMAIAALLILTAAATSTAVAAESGTRQPIELSYLGNAGWQIKAANKVILVDPYITEFRHDGSDSRRAGDSRRLTANEDRRTGLFRAYPAELSPTGSCGPQVAGHSSSNPPGCSVAGASGAG
jgi:hypothetical protein